MSIKKTALVIGATGLVGSALVHELCQLDHYDEVKVIARRTLAYTHPKLNSEICSFDHITSEHLIGIDDVFCCMGTTIKQAGSQPAFEQVDYHYPLTIATLAKQQQTKHFLVITAMGALESSPIFFNRVKGKLENRLIGLSFDRLSIIRPALLTGERTELRRAEKGGEKVFQFLNPLLIGGLRKFRSIPATTVARAMAQIAVTPSEQPVTVYTSDQLAQIAHTLPTE